MPMLSKQGRQSDEMKMNMTPMIDVVFNLIIFFMIVTEMTKAQIIPLELPRVEVLRKDDKEVPGRLILNISKEGKVYFGNYYVNKADLTGILKRAYDEMPKDQNKNSLQVIKIRADKATPYVNVQKVMLLCMENRIWKLSFGVLGKKAIEADETAVN